MNIIKHIDFFDPSSTPEPIHVIGCGAIGSTLAEGLARTGFENINLYDFDDVVEYNLANQMFYINQVGLPKVEAVLDNISAINPDLRTTITLHPHGYHVERPHKPLTGYIFLCVDNIDLRREITKEVLNNPNVKAVLDFRMALQDAQHYAADWTIPTDKEKLLKTMDFTHEEAAVATELSACGTTMSVSPTVRCIVSMGLANFINWRREPSSQLKTFIHFSPFFELDDRF